jgi:hypothetical protein
MRRCNNCKVNISGIIIECPLCQNRLEGKSAVSMYPNNIRREKDGILFKVLVFLSTIICIFTTFIEFHLTGTVNWSSIIILGIITAIISIYFIIINFGDVLKMISKYFILLLILLFIWFIATRNLIITTYIIPIVCITMLAFNSIILSLLKDYYKAQFISTIITDIIICFIPILLIIFNLTTINLYANICIIVNIIIVITLLIFFRRELFEELEKRLSV